MAVRDLASQRPESPGHLCLLDIGTADMVAEVKQHLGNPTHANPADAHKMDILNSSSSVHLSFLCSQFIEFVELAQ